MAEKSAIQRIKELDEERAKIFDQAKAEALEKASPC
jgi:vacuolar-type H+-ATPase subunit H